ncbi:MAG TPA: VWA domain-containing protein [Bryobacteraceae bacterium]|nr:VWA domain-containing protein [Bryobacteraceae bacterium]
MNAPHRKCLCLASALLAPVLVCAQAAAEAEAPPSFRVDVKLVRLLVNVKDSRGELIGGLDAKNFRVFDSGVPQDISVFERQTALPLSVSVLVDASGSTLIKLRYETTSVEKFLRALTNEGNPADAAALYSFNYDVTLLTNFTRRQSRLSSALRQLKPDGGTSLYDALYLAARDLERRQGRHVVVVVTDGGDTTSSKKFRDALEAAHLADVVVYPVLVVPITNDAGRNIGGEHALETIAEGTGGRVFTPAVGAELDAAFTQILRDLRTQYLVGYYPRNLPADTARFHTVRVEMDRKDLRPSTRSGYYGDQAAK